MKCNKCGSENFTARATVYVDVDLNTDLEIVKINEVLDKTFSEEFIYCKNCGEELINPKY